jgi:DNA (cytosine-5)-methyltransferase 1
VNEDENELTVVDLFCGAGGLSAGFQAAGFKSVLAIDSWAPAVVTYRQNLGEHVLEQCVTSGIELPRCDVLAGGPPCQGFSSAGLRKSDDERNSLVSVFATLIAEHRPKAFVFENVEGFLTGSNGKFVLEFLEPVIEAGYRVHLRKVNAANYGVPQHRKRVVAIGGLGWSPSFPAFTHSAFGAPGAELARASTALTVPTVSMALSVLPRAVVRGAQSLDEDHTYTPLDGDDLQRAQLLKPGQRMADLPEELWHDSFRKRAFRRVKDGMPTERRGGAPSGVRRLREDEPSKAITGGSLRDFLHPTENRPLTIRECAILQTFPETFQFFGSQADRIQLIGNAVPPLFASRIAECLKNDLACVEDREKGPGELLSFVPTLSTGMSPALESTTRQVELQFLQRSGKERQLSLWD